MKPGDLVRQTPNIFSDRGVAGKKMLVLKIDEAPDRTLVTTMLEGKEREWDYGELEVWREAR